MKKKIIYGIGTLVTIGIPVVATISCGNPARTVTLEKAKKADGFVLEFNPQGFQAYVELMPKKSFNSETKKLFIPMEESKANKVLEFMETLKQGQTAPNNWKPQTVYVKIKKDLDSQATAANLGNYFDAPYTQDVTKNGDKVVEDGFGKPTYTKKPINSASIVSQDVIKTDENDFLDAKGSLIEFGSSFDEKINAKIISDILIAGGVRIDKDGDNTIKGISDETLLGIKTYLDGSGYMINPKMNPTLEEGKIKTLDLIKKDSFDSVMMIKNSLVNISIKANSLPSASIAQATLSKSVLTNLGILKGFFPIDLKGTSITYTIKNPETNSIDLVATITKGKVSGEATIKITK